MFRMPYLTTRTSIILSQQKILVINANHLMVLRVIQEEHLTLWLTLSTLTKDNVILPGDTYITTHLSDVDRPLWSALEPPTRHFNVSSDPDLR